MIKDTGSWKRSKRVEEISSEDENRELVLSGWASNLRNLKSISFMRLRDGEKDIQITCKSDETRALSKKITPESVIAVRGLLNKNESVKGGYEIIAEKIKILNPAKAPLPLDVSGKVKADFDTRFDSRFMDLRNPRNIAIFRIQSKAITIIRDECLSQGFVEVHTPKIIATATEGGTQLFPVQYFEKRCYLGQSPQLYKEILMGAGFDRVFEVAPAFRAEEHNTPRHINEFVSIDIEASFSDHEDVMKILENLMKKVFDEINREPSLRILNHELPEVKLPLERITYEKCIKIAREKGVKIEYEEDISTEALKTIAEDLPPLYFITQWPSSIKPFYAQPFEHKPEITKSFDLMSGSLELASGAQRVHDPVLLKKRIVEKNLKVEDFVFYTKAFEYGMPPHSGWAIGAERLTSILTGIENIKECTLFPRDRRRVIP